MKLIPSIVTAMLLLSTSAHAHHTVQATQTFIDAAGVPAYAFDKPIRVVARRHVEHVARHEHAKPTHHPAPDPVKTVVTAIDTAKRDAVILGDMLGIPDGWEDGLSTPLQAIKTLLPKRPYQIAGLIDVDGTGFHFVTGGSGWSAPYGDWRITPDDVGGWGSRHGALGLNWGEDITDKQIGRSRDGIEIHEATRSGTTEGCFGVTGYRAFKKKVLAMIEKFGEAWLHNSPIGVGVSPAKFWSPPAGSPTVVAAVNDEPSHHRERRYARHRYRHYASR